MYEYRALVTEVYDGDTITVDIDLGLGVWKQGEKLRLYGINAPELRGPEREDALKSRDWLREQILWKRVVVRTIKDKKGKFGRYLANVYLKETDSIFINKQIVEAGHAVYKEY